MTQNPSLETASDGPPLLDIASGVARLTLSRPREHNRIDPADLPVIRAHLDAVARRDDVRVLVITGTGTRTFSSGYTLHAIVEHLDDEFERMLDAVESFPLPTICALNGSVYGGATDLALCCDFRIGLTGTRMLMPASKIAMHYYPGGLRRYVTQLGLVETKRIFFTAQPIDAEAMKRIGFLTDLVAPDALQRHLDDLVAALVACAPETLRSLKRQLNAIAAGEPGAATARDDHERSLRSDELKARVGALTRS